MARFAQALEENPAPRALGDVRLRYEPSMLIGETPRGQTGWRSTLTWGVGLIALALALAALVAALELALIVPLLAVGALGMGLSAWLERHEKRRRRFVANFATTSLRLDYQTPLAGHPRTLVVPFEQVKAVALLGQGDGAEVLCVDFEWEGRLLREALVAHIVAEQRPEAERLARVLEGAFGLGDARGLLGPSEAPPTTVPE